MKSLRYLIFLPLLGCSSLSSDDALDAELRAEFEAELAHLETNDDEQQFLTELRRRLQGLDKQQQNNTKSSSNQPGAQSATFERSQDEQTRLVEQAYSAYREQGEIPEPLLAGIRNEREVAFDALVRTLLSDPTTPVPAAMPLLRLDLPNEENQR